MPIAFKNVLVTGAAGFIGFHLSNRLLQDGCRVTGLDNMNPYYDVGLKKGRLQILEELDNTFLIGVISQYQRNTGIFVVI